MFEETLTNRTVVWSTGREAFPCGPVVLASRWCSLNGRLVSIKGTRDSLALLGKSGLLKESYLVGGTALALKKSLVYFADAEADEMPKMLKPLPWDHVKHFFEQEVKRVEWKK